MEMKEIRLNIEEYTRPQTFYSIFHWMVDEEKTFIVYITAGVDIVNGDKEKFWCPDCEAARASVDEHILSITELPIVQGTIKDLTEWNSQFSSTPGKEG